MVGKAAKITKQVLEDHFHLPMAEVAKKYGVCITYFKKVCRSHGVQRWPYRQMRSSIRKGTDDESSEKEGPQDSDSDYYSSSQGSPRYGPSLERDAADGKSDCRRSAEDGLQDESSRALSDTSNTNAMDVLAMLCVKEKTPPPAKTAPTPPPESKPIKTQQQNVQPKLLCPPLVNPRHLMMQFDLLRAHQTAQQQMSLLHMMQLQQHPAYQFALMAQRQAQQVTLGQQGLSFLQAQ